MGNILSAEFQVLPMQSEALLRAYGYHVTDAIKQFADYNGSGLVYKVRILKHEWDESTNGMNDLKRTRSNLSYSFIRKIRVLNSCVLRNVLQLSLCRTAL